ncbi:MAG: hypothetical protein EAZ74_05855 [Alphaproteobacteria bacterium]|nr:MAG: hypothetical protein EAY76_07210 [Alphaproteobacteria bacterium]TAF13376.1 MAG: hypothetical protein EAZ74_05855 [Alphaproteobacteria bacterium]TAF39347.1 MAG: hypothetical protein EAZ66_04850 [Alphaproteobacteria bacterium]TAF75129.1 MAG: hypothetical protein EAZ52_07520 [Alphaproteobacteria bacterium]
MRDTALNEWNQKEISQNALVGDEEDLLSKEDIVMLMQGKNPYGERIYCYLRLSINNLRRMKEAIINKEKFMPSDFGEVLAAGSGQPAPELRAEMAVTYGMMQTPKLEQRSMPLMQKPLWDD